MNLVLRYIFIGIYAVAGMFLLIQLGVYFGLPYDPRSQILLYMIWLVLCFTGYWWLPVFFLATRRVRKTILEEEEWLHPLMHELNLRSGIHPAPELLILEKPDLNAFAVGRKTVVVSRGLLVKLSELEIKAVLAHEYGHLKDRDTLTATAFSMASWIPVYIYRLVIIVFRLLKKWFWKRGGLAGKFLLASVLVFILFTNPDILVFFVFCNFIASRFSICSGSDNVVLVLFQPGT